MYCFWAKSYVLVPLRLSTIVHVVHLTDDATSTIQDLDKDEEMPEPYRLAPVQEVFELHKQEQARKKKLEKVRSRKLAAFGFEGEIIGEGIL